MAFRLTPGLGKIALTAHVVTSVGWLGAVIAYLVIALAGLTSADAQMVRGVYLVTALIGWLVIVPLSIAALLTGLVQSLGTEWGLFRHYWIVCKLALTVIGTTILLVHMRAVSRMAQLAMETSVTGGDHRAMRTQLVIHAAGGLLVLLTATVLSIYKPWGKTPYGLRPQLAPAATAGATTEERESKRGRYALLAIIAILVLLIVLHLAGGGFRGH